MNYCYSTTSEYQVQYPCNTPKKCYKNEAVKILIYYLIMLLFFVHNFVSFAVLLK